MHLHFEVKREINGVYEYIDPYGWTKEEGAKDPYKWAEYGKDTLWESTSSTDNPPTVSITSPANGATVSNTVTVSADATDDNGINKVEFYLDSDLKSTDTSSPYSWSWDTTQSKIVPIRSRLSPMIQPIRLPIVRLVLQLIIQPQVLLSLLLMVVKPGRLVALRLSVGITRVIPDRMLK